VAAYCEQLGCRDVRLCLIDTGVGNEVDVYGTAMILEHRQSQYPRRMAPSDYDSFSFVSDVH